MQLQPRNCGCALGQATLVPAICQGTLPVTCSSLQFLPPALQAKRKAVVATTWDNAAADAQPLPQTANPFKNEGVVPAPQLPMSQQRYIPLRPRGRPPAST